MYREIQEGAEKGESPSHTFASFNVGLTVPEARLTHASRMPEHRSPVGRPSTHPAMTRAITLGTKPGARRLTDLRLDDRRPAHGCRCSSRSADDAGCAQASAPR
jgi:hypothetical protein